MRKFVRQLILGIGSYIGFWALMSGMVWIIMLEPPNILHTLKAFGMITLFFGGIFGVILLMGAIIFGIFCLIHKVKPIDKILEIDREEEEKDFLEQKKREWKEEYNNGWNEFVKKKMSESLTN